MKKTISIAIVGATGVVGQTLLDLLAERKFPAEKIIALASHRSVGQTVYSGEKPILIQDLDTFDFSETDIAFFSAGGSVSAQYVPKATKAGAMVIDNTAHFRYDEDVPLVIAEVNPEDLKDAKTRRIIANPNCSTMQMLVALKPIYDTWGIQQIHVATYQAVSGAGRRALEELQAQSQFALNAEKETYETFSQPMAFNVLPQIDVLMENGYTKEEMKMVWETRKIFKDKTIQVTPTAVRVPVMHGHSEAVHIITKKPVDLEEAKALLGKAPGVSLYPSEIGKHPTPRLTAGTDPVYVGRLRKDLDNPCGLNMWVVSDNIRKGAALNAIQIAERLLQQGFE